MLTKNRIAYNLQHQYIVISGPSTRVITDCSTLQLFKMHYYYRVPTLSEEKIQEFSSTVLEFHSYQIHLVCNSYQQLPNITECNQCQWTGWIYTELAVESKNICTVLCFYMTNSAFTSSAPIATSTFLSSQLITMTAVVNEKGLKWYRKVM